MGDAILVSQWYDALRTAANGNVMAKYMPGLTAINDRFESTGNDHASTAEVDAVGNWPADWAASYNNTATRADYWDLSVAMRNDVRARDCWTTSYPSSGYTVRTINPDGIWSTAVPAGVAEDQSLMIQFTFTLTGRVSFPPAP